MRWLAVVIALPLLMVVPGEAQQTGGCSFKGGFNMFDRGPGEVPRYSITFTGIENGACTPGIFSHPVRRPLAIQAVGSARHIGRCSVQRTPTGAPWPTFDGLDMDGVVFSAVDGEFSQEFSLGQVGGSPFPGPTPISALYLIPEFAGGALPAGTAEISTRIFGNCPPRGNNTAIETVIAMLL
jgi:hypothetical protein